MILIPSSHKSQHHLPGLDKKVGSVLKQQEGHWPREKSMTKLWLPLERKELESSNLIKSYLFHLSISNKGDSVPVLKGTEQTLYTVTMDRITHPYS